SLTLLPPASTLFPYTTLFRSPYTCAFRRLSRERTPAPVSSSPGVDNAHFRRGRQRAAGQSGAAGCASEHPAGRCRSRTAIPCRRSEEHTSELQSRGHLVCRLL